MAAFISIFEVTILWLFLAVPTAIAYLRYRHRRRTSNATKSENLLLALGATVFGAAYIDIGLVAELLPTQPDKMLSRFLSSVIFAAISWEGWITRHGSISRQATNASTDWWPI